MNHIYLDHAATTPLREEVREAMAPCLAGLFGNPSSTHRWGREAATTLDEARERIAVALGAAPSEVVFVRGGTEGDNLAVMGRVEAELGQGSTPLVAATAVEHSAVRDLLPRIREMGGRTLEIPVGSDGALDRAVLNRFLEDPDACVLSVMWVNNEVGTIFPIRELAGLAREAGVTFHTDAVQALGKVPVRLEEVPADLVTITGHKVYGPKGTGALVVRTEDELVPRHFGGGQERGLRPGTQDVAGAVGLARAVELTVEEQAHESDRLSALRDRLAALLEARIPGLRIHGQGGPRAPHILNVGIPGTDRSAVIPALDMEGLAVSGGSACASGAAGASPVLRAMYGSDADDVAAVRFSLGRGTTDEDVTASAEITSQVAERLRLIAEPERG